MRIDSQLPEELWPYSMGTAAYVINRLIPKGQSVAPITLWRKELNLPNPYPSLAHLQPFGSLMYVHIHPEDRAKANKTAPRAIQVRLLGYEGDNGHIFLGWLENTKKVIKSRDVTFPRTDNNKPPTPISAPTPLPSPQDDGGMGTGINISIPRQHTIQQPQPLPQPEEYTTGRAQTLSPVQDFNQQLDRHCNTQQNNSQQHQLSEIPVEPVITNSRPTERLIQQPAQQTTYQPIQQSEVHYQSIQQQNELQRQIRHIEEERNKLRDQLQRATITANQDKHMPGAFPGNSTPTAPTEQTTSLPAASSQATREPTTPPQQLLNEPPLPETPKTAVRSRDISPHRFPSRDPSLTSLNSTNPRVSHRSTKGIPPHWLGQEQTERDKKRKHQETKELSAMSFSTFPQGLKAYQVKVPSTYKEAINSPERDLWIQAMKTQFLKLQSHNTWDLTTYPTHGNILPGKWVYDLKLDADNNIQAFRARWVICGNRQCPGEDFENTYAPVVAEYMVKLTLIKIAIDDLECEQVDIVTAYLNAHLRKHNIYMIQPTGFEQPGKPQVCHLKRALYGL